MTTQSVEHMPELTDRLVMYNEMVEYVKSKIDEITKNTTWRSGTLQGSTVSPPSSTLDFNPGKCSCCS